MTIGSVAKAVGLPESTIRYYESVGIIPKPSRKNGVRQFGPEAIAELKALVFYRASGIPIRGLAAIAARPRAAKAAVWAAVLRGRINDLDAWMLEAEKTKRSLEKVIACRCEGELVECEAVKEADAMEPRPKKLSNRR